MIEIQASGVFLIDLTNAFSYPGRISNNLLVRHITEIVASNRDLKRFQERIHAFTPKRAQIFFNDTTIRLRTLELQLTLGLTEKILNAFRLDLLAYKAFIDEFNARLNTFCDAVIPVLYQQAREQPGDPSIPVIKRLLGIDLYEKLVELIDKKTTQSYNMIPVNERQRIGEPERIQIGEILINELNDVAQSQFSNTNPLNAIERGWDTPDSVRFIPNRVKKKSREKLGLRNRYKPPKVKHHKTFDVENIKVLDNLHYFEYLKVKSLENKERLEDEDIESLLVEFLQSIKQTGQQHIFGRFFLQILKSRKLEDYLRKHTLNIDKLAKDADVSRDTVKRFLLAFRTYLKNK